MDEEVERLTISVRTDLGAFRRDVATMRSELSGPLEAGMRRAGDMLEASLLRAVRTGKFGFEDLKRVALSVMAEIARAAARSAGGGGGADGQAGMAALLTSLAGLGLPGRATGGPVSPGRPYMVGERGPEMFVPTASGRVEPMGAGPREVNVRVQVVAGAGVSEPQALQRSARQVARAVRRSLQD